MVSSVITGVMLRQYMGKGTLADAAVALDMRKSAFIPKCLLISALCDNVHVCRENEGGH
jgi:hypothetical protein